MRKILSLFAAMLFVFAANAAETQVSPGSGALKAAVDAASAGDVLVLAEGTYSEPEVVELNKNLTIKAAEGAHPVVAQQYYMKLLNSAQVTFIGIKFDGGLYNEGQGANDHCIRAYDDTEGKTLTVDACEFCNWKSYILYPQRANRCAASFTIRNCYFHDNKRCAVFTENEAGALGALTIENSTFANFTEVAEALISVKNGGTETANQVVRVDHCTFYNFVKNSEGDYSFIDVRKSTDVHISNCIFAQPTAGMSKATYCYGGAIDTCLIYNTNGHRSGNCVVTGSIEADPLFVDAANGDYTLGEGSPALAAGTEGSNLGDPRWWPAAPQPASKVAVLQYTGSTTTNMVGNGANNAATVGLDADVFTVLADKGSNQNFPGLNKAPDIRLYPDKNSGNGNSIIVSIENGTIDSIALDIKQTATYVVKAGETAVTGVANVFAINGPSFSIQNTTTGATTQLQLNKITIYYTGGEAPAVAKPAIAGETSFFGETAVTITCDTEGAAIYYTLDGTEPTAASTQYTAAFNLTASATVKAIAILGDDASAVVEAQFTKNPSFASFEALIAAGVADKTLVEVSFADIVIDSIYVNSSNLRKGIYFTVGETAYEIYYSNGDVVIPEEWVAGGKVSGTIRGQWTVYKGLWELVPTAPWTWAALTYAAPAPAHTYTVAGAPAALFINAWDPEVIENDLEPIVGGEYTHGWKKDSVLLEAGKVEFKVCEDHAWTIAYPAQNYELPIAENAYYTISIFFNETSKAVYAEATKVGEAPQPAEVWDEIVFTAVTAAGVFNDSIFTVEGSEFSLKCVDTENSKLKTTSNNASFGSLDERHDYTIRLQTSGKSSSKNNMELNIPADGKLRIAVRTGSSSDVTRTLVLAQGNDTICNKILLDTDTVPGASSPKIFNFIYVDVKAGKVAVTYPVNAINFYAFAFKADVVPPTVNYYVAGSMNGWEADENYMLTPNNESLYEGEFTFAANDAFKVIGYDGSNTTWYPEGTGNDYTITEAGDYKITFNPAGNVEGWYAGFFNVVKKETPAEGPTAPVAAPTWPANQVKAVYSATYNADCGFGEWGSGTAYTQDEYGKKYVTTGLGYFGLVFDGEGEHLNCSKMEKLHMDVWIAQDTTIRVVPIWTSEPGKEQGIFVRLEANKWNSVEIALADYDRITSWLDIYQIKIDEARNMTFWMNNIYFYTTVAPEKDSIAPTDVTADVVETSFFSARIKVHAKDNSGVVKYDAIYEELAVASTTGASDEDAYITVKNLAPNTDYNFSIVAKDESGNMAEPIVVAVKTLPVPAPAPTPDFTGKEAVAVFCDALENNPAIAIGQWGQTTIVEPGELAPGDNVYYCSNMNYLGWEFTPHINATDMEYVHIDFFAPNMTSINVTPISPGKEGVYTVQLTQNEWTSVDVPLSAYDNNGIDWSNIFQFKFMDAAPSGRDVFIDNVYFFKETEEGIENLFVEGKAVKVLYNGQILILKNNKVYTVTGQPVNMK